MLVRSALLSNSGGSEVAPRVFGGKPCAVRVPPSAPMESRRNLRGRKLGCDRRPRSAQPFDSTIW